MQRRSTASASPTRCETPDAAPDQGKGTQAYANSSGLRSSFVTSVDKYPCPESAPRAFYPSAPDGEPCQTSTYIPAHVTIETRIGHTCDQLLAHHRLEMRGKTLFAEGNPEPGSASAIEARAPPTTSTDGPHHGHGRRLSSIEHHRPRNRN